MAQQASGLATSGLAAQRRMHEAGEYLIEPAGEIIVCVFLRSGEDRSLSLEQVADGRLHEMTLRPGIVQVMPEGLPRTYRHRAPADHVHLHLRRGAVEAAAEELGLPTAELVPQVAAPDAKSFQLALAMLEDESPGRATGRLWGESLGASFLGHLLSRYSSHERVDRAPSPLPGRRLDRVMDYVEDKLDQDLSLDEMAGVSGLGKSRFSELFRRATGASPYGYVVDRRLSRAVELLSRSRRSIADIAVGSGFYDQSHLTRHMRRRLGVTPGQLRS